jgi:hypothetical protein
LLARGGSRGRGDLTQRSRRAEKVYTKSNIEHGDRQPGNARLGGARESEHQNAERTQRAL